MVAFSICVDLRPVWLVLGPHELGGRRDEAEGEGGRVVPCEGQLRPPLHPQPELQVPGGHPPHAHGTLQR